IFDKKRGPGERNLSGHFGSAIEARCGVIVFAFFGAAYGIGDKIRNLLPGGFIETESFALQFPKPSQIVLHRSKKAFINDPTVEMNIRFKSGFGFFYFFDGLFVIKEIPSLIARAEQIDYFEESSQRRIERGIQQQIGDCLFCSGKLIDVKEVGDAAALLNSEE